MTVFAVPSLMQAATAGTEIFSRVKDGTITQDIPLLGNQAFGIAFYLEGLALGIPGDPSGPVVPIGSAAPMSHDEAEECLKNVAATGAIPVGGSWSPVTVALRMALLLAAEKLPEPMRSLLKQLIEQAL